MRIQSLLAFLILLFAGVLTGCRFGLHSNISGSYQAPIEAATAGGHRWHGTASVLLAQTDRALSRRVVLHHPKPASFGFLSSPVPLPIEKSPFSGTRNCHSEPSIFPSMERWTVPPS